MAPAKNRKFFFIHIMKTGGTSFADLLSNNFTDESRFPDTRKPVEFFEHMETYIHVPKFLECVTARQGQLQMIMGHVPYATRSLLKQQYTALIVLRDPIERTISFLKHCRKYNIEHENIALEEIYEDSWFKATFMQNYQTKMLSMSAAETLAESRYTDGSPVMPPRAEMGDMSQLSKELIEFRDRAPGRFCMEFFAPSSGVIEIDGSRLELAKKNLNEIEVVGVTETYDRFLAKLAQEYDWTITSEPRKHVGVIENIAADFRSRIASDNAYDIELYEYAKSLVQ